MKKLILAFLPFTAFAQCPQEPTCQTNHIFSGALTNQNFNGNFCLEGEGTISNSVNWNNWTWFKMQGNINVQQTINFGGGAGKGWVQGNIKLNYITWNGGDTLIVKDNTDLEVVNLNVNNSFLNNFNTVILGNNSTFKFNGQYLNINDTLKTVLGNNSNNLYIIGCGTPLPLVLNTFKIINKTLYWDLEGYGNVVIERSLDGRYFTDYYFTGLNKGELALGSDYGFYRLRRDNFKSVILSYLGKSFEEENVIYYKMGIFYKDKPQGYFGTKKLR